MKKRTLIFVSLSVVAVLTAFLLTSCGLLGGNKNDREKTVTKVALTEDMVRINGTYVYTGEPITIDESHFSCLGNGRNIVMSSLDISYENNVEVGEATMIITAKSDNEYVKGTVRVHFQIVEDYHKHVVTTMRELTEELAAKRYSDLYPDFDVTIEEGETLTVDNGKGLHGMSKTVAEGEYAQGITIVNNGTLVIGADGRVNLGGSRDYTVTLVNNGALTVNGKLYLNSNSIVYNAGSIRTANASSIENYGAIFTNSPVTADNKSTGSVTLRKKVDAQSVSLVNPKTREAITTEGSEMRYKDAADENKAAVYVDGTYFSYATYENYDRAGTVAVTIAAEETDRQFYGSYSTSYTLYKGTATISDFSTFADAQATGNYDVYRVTQYGNLRLDGVTVAENETFILTESATVVDVTNYGAFSIEPRTYLSYLSFDITGSFVNYGALTFDSSAVDGAGTLQNGSAQDPSGTVSGKNLHVQTVVSYGAIDVEYLHNPARFDNYGSLTADRVFIGGSCDNHGEITAREWTVGAYTEGENSAYTDAAGATLTVTGEGRVRGSAFTVAGTCTIEDKITFAECAEVTVTGTFTNNGTLYAFEEIDGVTGTGTFVQRKNLTDDDVSVVLEYYTVDYDGAAHKPAMTVDGVVLQEYNTVYEYTDGIGTAEENKLCRRVGDLKARLIISNEFYPYYGRIDVSYRIEYGTTHTGYIGFGSKINDRNYGTIILDENVTYNINLSLHAHQTLDLNGYSLTIANDAEFTDYGTVIVRPIEGATDFDAVGLCVKRVNNGSYVPKFRNCGSVVNTGIVYFDQWAIYTKNENGAFENNGTIYTHVGAEIGATGEGAEYVRRTFSTGGAYEVELEYTETTYDGTEKEPTVTVTKNGAPMDTSVWTIEYADNLNAGDASVTICTEDPFDLDFYGTWTYFFTVTRATKELTAGGYLYSSDIADAQNYEKYVQRSNLKLSSANLTVPADVTLVLDLANYALTRYSNKINVEEGGRLDVIVDTLQEIEDFMYGATTVVFGADIGETSDVLAFTFAKNQSTSAAIGRGDPYTVKLDLNGHVFGGTMTLVNNAGNDDNDCSLTIVSSAETKGTIGYAKKYAFTQNLASGTPPSATVNVTFDNLTVYGASFAGGSNGHVIVSATNCDFVQSQAAANEGKWYALYIVSNGKGHDPTDRLCGTFTDCTFTAFCSAVMIYGGNTTFTNCDFATTALSREGANNTGLTYTGNCITIVSSAGYLYELTVRVVGGTFRAYENGYGMEYTLKNGVSSVNSIYVHLSCTASAVTGRLKYGW